MNSDAWGVKHRDLLSDLLVNIAQSLGINTAAIDIARGGYYPIAWQTREQRSEAIGAAQEKFANLLLNEEFGEWIQRMKSADYRAAFSVAVNEQCRRPAGQVDSAIG